ncbi:MAG TPA: hypothetical protein VM008_20250 [Phycisphaerae bacterium]|nr:hypothetical protein [Phycisphaerae bacterium]
MKVSLFAAAILAAAVAGTGVYAADPAAPGGGMSAQEQQEMTISGAVQSFNIGPRGGVEGMMVTVDGKAAQVNFGPELGALISQSVAVGDEVKATVQPDHGAPPPPGGGPGARRNGRGPGGGGPEDGAGGPPDGGPNGGMGPGGQKADHPVYRLVSLTDAKGKEIHAPSPEDRKAVHLEGSVKAVNYDARGLANGAQMENGDVVRMSPEDAKLLALASGMKLTVDGIATKMPTGNSMIDAHTVNGINVHSGGPGGGRPRGGPRGQRGQDGPGDGGPGQDGGPGGDAPPPPGQ